jgi:hypothetical protein
MSELLTLVVAGLEVGSLYALMALGLVLIYRTQSIVDFAHGELLMAGAPAGATRLFHTLICGAGWLLHPSEPIAAKRATAQPVERLNELAILAPIRLASPLSTSDIVPARKVHRSYLRTPGGEIYTSRFTLLSERCRARSERSLRMSGTCRRLVSWRNLSN